MMTEFLKLENVQIVDNKVYFNTFYLSELYNIPGVRSGSYIVEDEQVELAQEAVLNLMPYHSNDLQQLGSTIYSAATFYLKCLDFVSATRLGKKVNKSIAKYKKKNFAKKSASNLILSDKLQECLDRITTFFSPDTVKEYKRYGLKHRRGVLLYGPPGTGKTSFVYEVIRKFNDAIVSTGFGHHRPNPSTKVIIFLDEIESLLDGTTNARKDLLHNLENVEDNTLVLGTTNLPDMLGPEIYNRPGRFEEAIQIDYPNQEEINSFLKLKNSEDLIEFSAGLNFAHLNELIYRTKINKEDYERAYLAIKKLDETPILDAKTDPEKVVKIGF